MKFFDDAGRIGDNNIFEREKFEGAATFLQIKNQVVPFFNYSAIKKWTEN